ncbi:MAG: tetratricopeptide repeat protein [Acidobacteria bacterium]|nr:tetratricopeptide repeat protein [Acidobacteriota bacterium]
MNASRGRRFALVCLLMVLTGLGFQPVKSVTAASAISIQEPPPALAPIQELQPGTPVERSFKPEELHRYTIQGKAEHFMAAWVTEKGVNLVVEVFAPDGKKLISQNGVMGRGKENVRLLLKDDGLYRVQVKGYTPASAGDYVIETVIRQPTENDRLLLAADDDYYKAQSLYNTQTPEALEQAIAQLKTVLRTYQTLNQIEDQGSTYALMGHIWLLATQIQNAQEAYAQALKIYLALNDELSQALILEKMGQAALSNNEDQKGLDLYLQSLKINEKLGNQVGVTMTYLAIGVAYNRFGEKQKALECYQKSLPLAKKLEFNAGIAATLNNMGRVYDDLGEEQKALEYYFEAIPFQKTLINKRPIGITHNNIGKIYLTLGDSARAIEHFEKALEISSSEKDQLTQALALFNLGRVFLETNQTSKALDFLGQAQVLAQETKNQVQQARIMLDLATAHIQGGNQARALEILEQGFTISTQTGDRSTLANYYVQKGKLTENSEEKLVMFQKALELRQVLNEPATLAQVFGLLTTVERDRGNLGVALQHIEHALQLVEKIRSNVTSDQFRTSYFATIRKYYDIYLDLLIRSHQQQPAAHFLATAFEISERAHARGLLDLINESRIDIRQGVDPKLLEQERNLKQLLQDKSNRLLSLKTRKTSAEGLQAAEKEIAQYREEYQQVRNQIRQASPRYSALTEPQPLSLKQIQAQVLAPDTILLEYHLGEKVSYVWVVSPAEIEVYELPKQEVINDLARKAYESVSVKEPSVRNLSAVKSPTDNAAQTQNTEPEMNPMLVLSQMILGPVRSQLGTKRVVIVPDGALHLIPFAALPVPQATEPQPTNPKWSYLIEHNEIITLPSASTLAVLRQETATRQPAPKKLAILADPVFSKEDVRVVSTVNPSPAPGQPESTQVATRNLTALKALENTSPTSSSTGFTLTRLPGTRKEAKTLYSLIAPTQGKLAMDFEANREFGCSSANTVILNRLKFGG